MVGPCRARWMLRVFMPNLLFWNRYYLQGQRRYNFTPVRMKEKLYRLFLWQYQLAATIIKCHLKYIKSLYQANRGYYNTQPVINTCKPTNFISLWPTILTNNDYALLQMAVRFVTSSYICNGLHMLRDLLKVHLVSGPHGFEKALYLSQLANNVSIQLKTARNQWSNTKIIANPSAFFYLILAGYIPHEHLHTMAQQYHEMALYPVHAHHREALTFFYTNHLPKNLHTEMKIPVKFPYTFNEVIVTHLHIAREIQILTKFFFTKWGAHCLLKNLCKNPLQNECNNFFDQLISIQFTHLKSRTSL